MSATIDAFPLARAVHLDCQPAGFGRYLVGDRVVLVDGRYLRCGCPDHLIRGAECKHLLATRLNCGDPDVVRALRALIAEPAQRRRVAA